MPLLVHAVPLRKNWLGTHSWDVTPTESLPPELEYLTYEQFQDRFKQLNKIARPTYPTQWPNVGIFFLICSVIAAAVFGISNVGSNLAIMGQGACFLLPIIIVVWIKVRRTSKTKARRKFRQQSQKLLRTWTTDDSEAHAFQWKIRQRPMSVAKRWLDRQPHGEQYLGQDHASGPGMQGNNALQLPAAVPAPPLPVAVGAARSVEADGVEHSHHIVEMDASLDPAAAALAPIASRVYNISDPMLIPPSGSNNSSSERPTSPDADVATLTPSADGTSTPGANDYPALEVVDPNNNSNDNRNNAEPNGTDLTPRADASEQEPEHDQQHHRQHHHHHHHHHHGSLWENFKAALLRTWCCAYIFRERRVWLIEISLRECELDEYTLTVPTPVYCGYRLPGYDDAMGLTTSRPGGESQADASAAPMSNRSANSSRLALHRFWGSPPAYESDSDNDSIQRGGQNHQSDDEDDDDDDDDDDDNDGVVNDNNRELNGGQVRGSSGLSTRSFRNTSRGQSEYGATTRSGNAGPSVGTPPPMVMVRRPVELTSVIVMGPRPIPGRRPLAELASPNSSLMTTSTLASTFTSTMSFSTESVTEDHSDIGDIDGDSYLSRSQLTPDHRRAGSKSGP